MESKHGCGSPEVTVRGATPTSIPGPQPKDPGCGRNNTYIDDMWIISGNSTECPILPKVLMIQQTLQKPIND
jgi:hypothetical protein